MKIHRINTCKRCSDTEVADTDTNADIKGQVQQIFEQAEK